MVGDSKLDMSLDALIKKQKQQKPVGAKAKLQQKQKGKPGSQQKQQAGAGGGAKGKPMPQQQARKGVPLKAKGGVGKPSIPQRAGPGKATGGQQKPGQQRVRQNTNVRVVPRPGPKPQAGINRPGPAAGRGGAGPRPAAGRGGRGNFMASNAGPMMQRPSMGFMAPAMMSPQQQQMMMMQQQQQMMQQQQAAPQAGKWQNDLFDGSVVSSSTSAKLLVSNLDFKVTDEDIKELFGTVGTIKESGIHYDKSGRSMGTATVIYERRQDALAAFNRYNNVALDNKKMSIEVVETAVPRGTFKTLSSGINVSRPQGAAGARGRGVPQGDAMQE